MNCQEATEFLHEYLDGNLAESVLVEFEIHIKKCGWCTEYLESYRKTVTITRSLGNDPPHIPVPEELVQAILAARMKQ